MTKRILLVVAVLGWMSLTSPALRAEAQCIGDCNTDGKVAISELVLAVDIAGGSRTVADCQAIDANGNHHADIDELVDAVVSSISVCGTVATPTFTFTPPPAAGTATPTPSPTGPVGTPVCGNGVKEADEECDDGAICVGAPNRVTCTQQSDCAEGQTCRAVGGDGCAANCTNELAHVTELNPCPSPLQLTGQRDCAGANLSAGFITNVEIPLSTELCGALPCNKCANNANQQCTSNADCPGSFCPTDGNQQVLTTGTQRDNAWVGIDGQTHDPLIIPIVIKAKDVKFDPANVFNLFCACVVPVPDPLFGFGFENGQEVGLSGSGDLGCNAEGLTDINFLIEQDHNTTPGDPGNGGPENGLPDDPQCNSVLVSDGFPSHACLEGTDPACSGQNFQHVGVCQSPRKITLSGGPAGRGSVFLRNQTALKLLAGPPGENACTPHPDMPGAACPTAEFGPDCIPCTDDDLPANPPVANNTPTTSGTATVIIYDFKDEAGVTMNNGSPICPPRPPGCVNVVQGTPSDCDALLANPSGPLSGVLATAFPGLDANTTGDSVTTTTLGAKR
jgi:hypothetical protein